MAYYENETTSALIESINGKLQLARKRAMGFRNVENFKAIAYRLTGGIEPCLDLPNPAIHTQILKYMFKEFPLDLAKLLLFWAALAGSGLTMLTRFGFVKTVHKNTLSFP